MAEAVLGPIDFSALLDELESGSSGSCASVIRKLREYEVAAYEAGQGGPTGELIANFIARLDERVADRELEIEKTCSHNYESFVESVQELMLMQEKAEELQETLRQIRSNVESSVQRLNASSEAFTATHATISRIDQCIAALRTSLPVLDQYEKVEKCIGEGRYYHALKSLEYLEHYQLKSIQSFAFSQVLAKRIPELRAEIKSASLAQLTDFLEEIRKHSIRLGAIAMHQTAEKMGMREEFFDNPKAPSRKAGGEAKMLKKKTSSSDCDDSDLESARAPRSRTTVTSNVFQPDRINVVEAELEELTQASKKHIDFDGKSVDGGSGANWRSAKNNIENLINFGPIYRCLHIHSVSGERSEFEHYYFTQRRKQCQLILSLSPSQQSSLRNYSEFFSRVVGFFLVDDYLRHTMPGAVASGGTGVAAAASYYQSYLADLWGTLVPRLTKIISRNASGCTTTGELLSLKHHCVLFERTMANLGFHTAGLNEMVESVRRQFSHLLIGQWKNRFEEIFKNDNYTAIRLESASDLTPELTAYPYCQSVEFTTQAYPRSLVFSPMVPQIYAAVRDYIDASVQFIAAPSADMAWTELEDSLNRATNVLFTECLAALLNTTLEAAETNLLRLIQLTINLSELEGACEHLQTYLHEHARPKFFSSASATTTVIEDRDDEAVDILALIASQPDDVQPSRSHLYGVSLFRDCRARAETQIYTHLNSRIEEFCSLASYDGIFGGPGEGTLPLDQLPDVMSEDSSPRTSGYMVDMMAWLSSTFAAFTHLAPKVAHTACISACKYIVKILQRILMGPEVKMVAEPALSQMLVDLVECDKFARSNPVPGIDKSILLLIFSELRQLLELVRNSDWSVFFATYGKTSGNPYERVTPAAAIALLECIREAQKRRYNTPSFLLVGSSKRPERERRRRLDDILRQLKDLQSAPTASRRF
ncbi:Exocyst complex component 6B [Taenia crassiceps]|uniref:Exocyst complex component n=1 Tax=Taenia crassiceps TaxID=6207 RepID=A0ABR4Q1R3_9CEST